MVTQTPFTKEEFFRRSFEAIQQAARNAREVAIQTGTAIAVIRDGRIVRIPAEDLKRETRAG